ncbi:MAG: hypothetical protein Q7J84_19045, partial [Sulfuricaulis sp.]|nr:hypothetical protein [Sulfuricaulis sp.]
MDEKDAVLLTNFFPSTTSVNLRGGYSQFATGFGAQVETVISYSGATTNKMFGIAGGSVYDATAGGAVGAAALSGLTNSRWQYVNISTSGGNFIIMCNGADGVYTFDGTNWVDRSASITGVTASTLVNVCLHKNRPWFIENNSLKAWYFPVQSIQGAASALDLSAFCPHGGYLMAMCTWTMDAGYGVDDMAVFITSNGDCLVYRGTDPSSSSTWALVGVFWIGSPVGRRCFVKYKGDVLLITQDGLLPLSGALQSSRVDPRVAVTDKISTATSNAVKDYGANFGWCVIPFPKQDALFLNVPISPNANQQQYVMNMVTGAWCNFTGWLANCLELYEENLYFGGTNFIGKAWDTNADAGQAIPTRGLQAFSYFGSRAQLKHFTMMRPTFYASSPPAVLGQINVDYDQSPATATLAAASAIGSFWDVGLWDGAVWGAGLELSRQWQGAAGVGYCGAPNINTNTNSIELQWLSTDVVFEP